jgi:hypothetical protein
MKKESKIQQEIVMYVTNNFGLKHHNPKFLIFSVPNEGKNAKEQMYKKMLGLKSGVSDLILVMPSRVVFVECKDDTGKQSESQKEFESDVTALGFEYWLVRSLDDFKAHLQNIFTFF